ncbi:MAG: hypothetical protein ILA39_04390 [Bacteroidaceae bacterium]|nr:hypothetical protein [Bacteroidaceae bacterium]
MKSTLPIIHCLLFLYLLSSCKFSQINGIRVAEIKEEEFNLACINSRGDPHLCDIREVPDELLRIFLEEYADSIEYFYGTPFKWGDTDIDGNSLVDIDRILINNKDSLYFFNVQYPIGARAYIYRADGQRISEGIFGYGIVDGNIYVSHEDFDSDEYVWYRIYQLSTDTVELCAEIKSSYDYHTPIMDNSYFFGEDHFFYFMVMKKGEESLRYYKADVSKRKYKKNSICGKRYSI